MKKGKITSLCLATFMLLGSLASCGQSTENPSETNTDVSSGTQDTVETVTKSADEEKLEELKDLDWNNESVGLLSYNGLKDEVDAINGTVDASGGSAQVINDAVYERNSRLETLGNLKLDIILEDASVAVNMCERECQSSTGDFYITNQRIYETVPLSVKNYMYDFVKLGVDLEQSWWDAGTANFSLGGNIFFMTGDANTKDDDVTYVLIFNKEMQKRYVQTVPNPYETVKNQEWTLDYFSTVIQGVSSDSNGDGKWDSNDTYGFLTTWEYGNTLFIGSGLRYIINSRDVETPELYLNDSGHMNKALTVLDKVQDIYHVNNSTFMSPAGNEGLGMNAFKQGRGMFFGDSALYLNAFNREMQGDYGVLPVPKYDKAQESYLTWTHESGSCLSVTSAVTEDKADLVRQTLELYAVLSSQTVKKAYYDIMLTSRNVRDAESADMLDIIFNNRVFDMAMYFSEELGFYPLFKTAVNDNKDNFSSGYASVAKRFDRSVNNILKKLK